MSDRAGRSTRPRQLIYPYELSSDLKKKRYMYEKFSGQPIVFQLASTVLTTPVAGQGTTNYILTPNGNYIELFQTTAQTLMPAWTAGSGLEIALDQVDNESVEYVPGGNNTENGLAFVSGTDAGFFVKAKFKITDASGMDQFLVGFRKQEAFAVPTSVLTTGDGIYTDFFGVGFASTKADPNNVYVAYDLNNGGSTTVADTGFDWADGLVHTLEVRVVGRKALVLINGVLLGDTVKLDGDGGDITDQNTLTTPAFTFDSGDTLVPFIFVRQDADLTPVYLKELEVGLLRDVGKDKNFENVGE